MREVMGCDVAGTSAGALLSILVSVVFVWFPVRFVGCLRACFRFNSEVSGGRRRTALSVLYW